jgi:hypothetical protein
LIADVEMSERADQRKDYFRLTDLGEAIAVWLRGLGSAVRGEV